MKRPGVYILASQRDGVLYTGVTSNLWRRMEQHVQHLIEGFTAKYDVTLLVYCEFFDTMNEAITREKRLKFWRRRWKVKLIECTSPEWVDLFDRRTGEILDSPVGEERSNSDIDA